MKLDPRNPPRPGDMKNAHAVIETLWRDNCRMAADLRGGRIICLVLSVSCAVLFLIAILT